MPSARYLSTALLALVATLALACTDDSPEGETADDDAATPVTATAEGGETSDPTSTATGTSPAPSPEATVSPTAGTPSGGAALAQTCEAPAYTIGYPEDWHVNAGTEAEACGWFSRQPIDVERGTELITQVIVGVEPVLLGDLLLDVDDSSVVDETTIDGRRAVRIETQTNEGLVPEGVPITQYWIDLGTETLIATTYDLEGYAYSENQQVLNAMARSLEFTGN